jgi:hypothetical protein
MSPWGRAGEAAWRTHGGVGTGKPTERMAATMRGAGRFVGPDLCRASPTGSEGGPAVAVWPCGGSAAVRVRWRQWPQ